MRTTPRVKQYGRKNCLSALLNHRYRKGFVRLGIPLTGLDDHQEEA